MKIGFDFRMGGSINAGIGRYSFELLKALIAEADNDEFFVFYHQRNSNPEDLEELHGPNVHLIPANYRHYSWQEQLLFPKLLNRYELDIVHFPNFNVPIFYKKDFVVTIHDMVHHKISGHKKSRIWKFYAYKKIITHAATKAKKIITITEAAKKEIIEFLKVDPNKIAVTYEAPPANSHVKVDVQGVKKKFLLSRPYFIFLGTMERKKNIPTLAKGFDLFLNKYRYDMDLVIAGKVDIHYPEIKQQILDIENSNRIVFTDYISNSDQLALYQGAFAFVSASLHEGFGLPGVEAMQYGLPLLVSDTDVFNEVYDNAAIYFDPLDPADIAEKMHLIAKDQQFYQQMQSQSLARSTMFSWQEAAQKTLTVYHEAKTKVYEPESEY